jgi:hypothetical protein
MVRSVGTVFVLTVFALGAWAQAPSPQQAAPGKKEVYLPSKHSAWPTMGEFEGDPSETPQQRAHRQAREAHLGSMNPFSAAPETDPGLFVDGQTETSGVLIIDTMAIEKPGAKEVPEPRGIPAWGSSAVIIGTILSGKSFMNSQRNNVYSDYQVRVDEILKPDKTAKLTVGQQVLASRTGGRIRFPSGHITNFGIHGRGLPIVGSQYILFLKKTAPDLPEYRIGWPSSYEIRDGKVYPLDDDLREYEGFSAPAFLGLVRDTIASSKGGK